MLRAWPFIYINRMQSSSVSVCYFKRPPVWCRGSRDCECSLFASIFCFFGFTYYYFTSENESEYKNIMDLTIVLLDTKSYCLKFLVSNVAVGKVLKSYALPQKVCKIRREQ